MINKNIKKIIYLLKVFIFHFLKYFELFLKTEIKKLNKKELVHSINIQINSTFEIAIFKRGKKTLG